MSAGLALAFVHDLLSSGLHTDPELNCRSGIDRLIPDHTSRFPMFIPRVIASVHRLERSKLHDRNRPTKLIALVAISAMIAGVGCSSLPSFTSVLSSQVNSRNPEITLNVSPEIAVLSPNQKQQFTANITGTPNTAVTWSASSGSISSSGLYTAPASGRLTEVTITAISNANNTSGASALVKIQSASTVGVPTILTPVMAQAEVGTFYSETFKALGGTEPYAWHTVSGNLPTGLKLSSNGQISGVPTTAGTFAFALSVTDSHQVEVQQSVSIPVSPSGNYDGPAELPRVFLNTSLADTPARGGVTHIYANGDLQSALNNASCGDTIELQAGATFSGAYRLRAKSCDDQHWIIIRTSTPDSALPPEGTRMTPCYAGVSSLPGRPSFNCSAPSQSLAQILGKPSQSPISLDSGANHYRLIGLEVTRPAGMGITYALVYPLGTADHIILDRVWFHGTAHDETTRGIYLDGVTNGAIVDSYFNDFHCTAGTGVCTDSQAIAGGNGKDSGGPYKIVGNFLEAAAENIMFGGGGVTTISPADIEIRRNHLFKPMNWLAGQPGFVGGPSGHPFVVKNLFELKNAVRVLFEANILENTWGGFSQAGYAILLTPRSHVVNGVNVCASCQVTDVTIRYNIISHVGAGLQLANAMDGETFQQHAYLGGRYSIHDITVDDINSAEYKGHGTFALILNAWPTNVLNSITINHVSAFPDLHTLLLLDSTSHPKISGFTFTNNVIATGRYPVWSAGGGLTNCAISDKPALSISTCFSNPIFTNNALIAAPSAFGPSTWPSGNTFPSTVASVQFLNFNNGNGGDYQFHSSSAYVSSGSDGKPLGADVAAINAAVDGVY
jgi:hypothetical protein